MESYFNLLPNDIFVFLSQYKENNNFEASKEILERWLNDLDVFGFDDVYTINEIKNISKFLIEQSYPFRILNNQLITIKWPRNLINKNLKELILILNFQNYKYYNNLFIKHNLNLYTIIEGNKFDIVEKVKTIKYDENKINSMFVYLIEQILFTCLDWDNPEKTWIIISNWSDKFSRLRIGYNITVNNSKICLQEIGVSDFSKSDILSIIGDFEKFPNNNRLNIEKCNNEFKKLKTNLKLIESDLYYSIIPVKIL